MKNIIRWLVLVLLTALHVSAQIAGQVVSFTNKVVTITNLHGEAFQNIRLIRADAKGMLYMCQDSAGGGRINYTDLSPSVVKSLGLAEDSAEKSILLTANELAEQRRIAEEEKTKMLNPANWRVVHLMGLSFVSGDTWMAMLAEMPGSYLIHYVPATVVDYFKDANLQVYSLNQQKGQLSEIENQIQQKDYQLANLKQAAAEIREQRRRGDVAQSNEIVYGAGNVNYAWNAEMDRREEQNRANTDQASEEKLQLASQQRSLQSSIASQERKVKALLEKRSGSAGEIRIFTSRSQYGGNPILFAAGKMETASR